MTKLKKPISLMDRTFKKIDTVADLAKFLQTVPQNEKVFMFSDEEGNQVNKILCLELSTEGITFIPWEQFDN